MPEPGAERPPDRPAPVALGPDADRGAAEEARFAELRSLLVGPERREVVDLKAHLADRHARTLEVSGVLPDAIAQSAKDPQLARALSPAVAQAISASVREDPQALTDALAPVIRRAARKLMAQALTPLITLGCAALLVGGVWTYQTFRSRQQWNNYIDRLSTEPGIIVIHNGRRDGKFVVSGLRDELAADPTTLLSAFGLNPDLVESRWEPYQALHPAFVAERARLVLQPPPSVTLTYNDGVLTVKGNASPEWIRDSQKVALALAGVRRFDYPRDVAASSGNDTQEVTKSTESPLPPPEPVSLSKPETVAETAKPIARPNANSPESRLMEQIEVSTLVFGQTNRELAPGQEGAVRRLATLFGELNEIVHARGLRARVEVIGHTDDSLNVANRRLARARADAAVSLFRSYKFDALALTASPDAIEETTATDRDRHRRVSFRVRLFERS